MEIVGSELVRSGLNLGVFCSANNLEARYTDPARELVRSACRQGYDLVWGGSNIGLMEIVATEAQQAGAKLYGVTVDFLAHYAREDADEMLIVENLAARKDLIVQKSDALAVLVGGTGTLDEVTDIIEHKKYGKIQQPIVFLDTDGFYEGLRMQLIRMADDGLLTKPLDELVFFADQPEQAVDYINLSVNTI